MTGNKAISHWTFDYKRQLFESVKLRLLSSVLSFVLTRLLLIGLSHFEGQEIEDVSGQVLISTKFQFKGRNM